MVPPRRARTRSAADGVVAEPGLHGRHHDRDGHLDYVTGTGFNGPEGTTFRRGNGDGTFRPPLFLPMSAPYEHRGRVVAADLNHDGVPDFLLGVYDSQAGAYRTAVLLSNP